MIQKSRIFRKILTLNALFIVTINPPVIIKTIKAPETNLKKLKKTIKKTKASFLRKALSDKQPAKVWDTVHRILNKQHDRIKLRPSDLNIHLTSLAPRLTRKINEPYDSTEFFQNISDDVNADTLKIRHTNYVEVQKIVLEIKIDCSMGHDGIPICHLKPVVDDITSPLVHIINTCFAKRVFPSTWKIARACPVPKVDHAKNVTEFRPISILCKFLNELYCIRCVIFKKLKLTTIKRSWDFEKDILQLHYC